MGECIEWMCVLMYYNKKETERVAACHQTFKKIGVIEYGRYLLGRRDESFFLTLDHSLTSKSKVNIFVYMVPAKSAK